MIRIIALMIMVIPGVFAAYGVKLMRDMVFGILHAPLPYLWLQFIIGLLMVIFGVEFIAGFSLHPVIEKEIKFNHDFKKQKSRV